MQASISHQRSTSSMIWLPGLLMTTFVIGTDDFIIAGILPEIAADFAVGEAAAGQLVTVFSLVYAGAAPVMAVATARLPRKQVIVGGLAAFALINLATAFAPNYAALMTLRVAAALVAATINPAAFAIAGSLAPADRAGRAIGAVAAGLTISLIVGVPLGSGSAMLSAGTWPSCWSRRLPCSRSRSPHRACRVYPRHPASPYRHVSPYCGIRRC